MPTAGDYLSTQTAPQSAVTMPAPVAAQHACPILSLGHSSAATPHLQTAAATMPAQKDAQPTQTADPILESAPFSVAMSQLQTDAAVPDLKDGAFGPEPFSHGNTCELTSHAYQCLAQPDMVHGMPTGTAPLPLPAPSTVSSSAATPHTQTASSEISPSGTPHPQTAATMPTTNASMPDPMTNTILVSATSSVATPHLETATSTPGASLSPQEASQRATAMPLQPANPEITSALPRTSMSPQTSSHTADAIPLEVLPSSPPSAMPHLQTAASRPLQTANPENSSALPKTSMSSQIAAAIPLEKVLPSSGMPYLQTASTSPKISSALPHLQTAATMPTINAGPPAPISGSNLDSVSSFAATPHLETATALPACRPPIASFKLAESSIRRSMMALVKAQKGSKNPSRLDLAHFTDTGGQPEYMESVPSLIHHCDLVMLAVNLKFDVDEYPPVHYHEKGRKYKRALPSQFSNRQIIQKLAMTLQAKRFAQSEGKCFRLLVVATHRDCVPLFTRLSTRVRAYHKALTEIFLPACEKELICYSDDEIPFVLNLKKPNRADWDKLDLIPQKVDESGVGEVIKTPGAFFIFEQVLMEFAEKVGRDIMHIDECFQVGEELKMGPDMVRSALIFFHHQITFLYYHHVMPNLVFTRPQVPLDCMNAIVQFKYKVESGELKGVTKDFTTSVKDGIITEEILSH